MITIPAVNRNPSPPILPASASEKFTNRRQPVQSGKQHPANSPPDGYPEHPQYQYEENGLKRHIPYPRVERLRQKGKKNPPPQEVEFTYKHERPGFQDSKTGIPSHRFTPKRRAPLKMRRRCGGAARNRPFPVPLHTCRKPLAASTRNAPECPSLFPMRRPCPHPPPMFHQ